MNDNNNKDFLTAKEISKYFRIPLNTVYRLSKEGKIKGVKIGKQWRYVGSVIEKYLAGELNAEHFNLYTDKKFKERRAYPRMNCNFQCRYRTNIPAPSPNLFPTGERVKVGSDFISYGYIRNVGGGGVFLHDEVNNLDHINVGDPVELIIDFISDAERQETIIDAKGRVVRKTHDGLGIKFRSMRDKYKNLIIEYVG